ncbi:MAG: oligosaccharide repeat unit polymerase [Clostridium sp.]|nr:oligosaccharide repeat unit polymerase [Clostridium sp.]
MISLIFIIEMTTFVILYSFKCRRTKNYIHIDLIFLLAYILITSAYFFQKNITNNVSGMFFVRNYVEKTVLITFGGFISYVIVCIFMEITASNKNKVFVIGSNKKYIKRYYKVSLFLCIIITFLNIGMYIVNDTFTKARGEGQFEVGNISMAIAQLSIFQLLLLLILVQLSYLMYNRISKEVLILLATIFVVAFILGERLIIVLSILGIVIIRNSCKKIKFKTTFLILVVGAIFNYIVTNIRIMSKAKGILSNVCSLEFGIIDIIKGICETLACSDIDTLITSLYVNSDKLLYGKSYLGSLVNVLFPKTIFRFYFFEPINVTFRKQFYSKITTVGYDFTMVSESIMNFGVLGPAIIMAILSFVVFKLSRNLNINDIFMPLKILIIMRIMFALRTDSNGIIKIIVYSSIFFMILIFIVGKNKLVKKQV